MVNKCVLFLVILSCLLSRSVGVTMSGEGMSEGGGSGVDAVAWARQMQAQAELREHLLSERMRGMEEHLRAFTASQMPPSPQFVSKEHDLKPVKPTKFRGDNVDVIEVTVWLFCMESYFDASRVTGEMERVAFAAAMLDGPAQTWWMTVKHRANDGSGPPSPCTWMEFGTNLTQRFQPVNANLVARDKLMALRQTDKVSAYASTFQQLLLRCPDIGIVDQLHRFIRGLKPTVQRELVLHPPVDLNDAICRAERANFSYTSNPTTFHPNYGQSSHTPMEMGAVQLDGVVETDEVNTDPNVVIAGLHEQINALRLRGGQNLPRGSIGKAWTPRQGSWRTSGVGQGTSARVLLTPQQRATRNAECQEKNLCFKCMKSGHRAEQCTGTWRPNV